MKSKSKKFKSLKVWKVKKYFKMNSKKKNKISKWNQNQKSLKV
jgi:hypothetical protein